MASAELSRRVERVVGYPPLSEMDERQRREFQEALLDADSFEDLPDSFEDLPGKWQAAILRTEQNRAEAPGRSRLTQEDLVQEDAIHETTESEARDERRSFRRSRPSRRVRGTGGRGRHVGAHTRLPALSGQGTAPASLPLL
jgi:hypothetical protein